MAARQVNNVGSVYFASSVLPLLLYLSLATGQVGSKIGPEGGKLRLGNAMPGGLRVVEEVEEVLGEKFGTRLLEGARERKCPPTWVEEKQQTRKSNHANRRRGLGRFLRFLAAKAGHRLLGDLPLSLKCSAPGEAPGDGFSDSATTT